MSVLGTATFDNIPDMAAFIAELVKQGVTFEAGPKGSRYEVRLTGGF